MVDILTTPFRSSILKEFARIIFPTFTKSQITRFFEEIGCRNVVLPSWKTNQVLHFTLVELQNNSGPSTIIKLIEIVCDPQEHIRKSDRHEKIVKKFNECLEFYSIKINERSKLVLIHKEKKIHLQIKLILICLDHDTFMMKLSSMLKPNL